MGAHRSKLKIARADDWYSWDRRHPDAQFLQANQNLFTAVSTLPLDFQSQVCRILYGYPTFYLISYELLQSLETQFHEAKSAFTTQQAQTLQAALSALQQLTFQITDCAKFKRFQLQLDLIMRHYRCTYLNLRSLESGLVKFTSYPLSYNTVSAKDHLIEQINKGVLSAAIRKVAKGRSLTDLRLLMLLSNFETPDFDQVTQDALSLCSNRMDYFYTSPTG